MLDTQINIYIGTYWQFTATYNVIIIKYGST